MEEKWKWKELKGELVGNGERKLEKIWEFEGNWGFKEGLENKKLLIIGKKIK